MWSGFMASTCSREGRGSTTVIESILSIRSSSHCSTKEVTAGVKTFHSVSLYSELSRHEVKERYTTSPYRQYHSEEWCSPGRNLPTVFHTPSQNKCPQKQEKWVLSVKWQLRLHWKGGYSTTTVSSTTFEQPMPVESCTITKAEVVPENVLKLIPSVTMVPNTDIEEKLGDVWIVPGMATVNVDGSESHITLPSDKPIVLKKLHSYKCNLTPDDSPIEIRKSQFKGKVCVKVEIIVIKNTLEIIEPVDIPPCTVLQNFSTLLVTSEEESKEKFCDVKIISALSSDLIYNPETESFSPTQMCFYAHKAILVSRSPVFATMFSSDMLESATNTLTLPDIEPDVVKELLTYIYTGESPNIAAHAFSLLGQAEKYQLNHLKALREEQLSYNLQISNAAKILVLADMVEAKQLKRNALLFINKHGPQVQRTDDWEAVKKSAELLHDLVSTMYENTHI